MEEDRFRIEQYKISGDSSLMDEVNHITPEVHRILNEIHPDVQKGRKYLIKKLNRLCRKYPKVPVFKNLLSTLYQHLGNPNQAYAVNQWLVKEHPDYLFGRLNLAAELLKKNEPEKVPEFLGEYMDIGQLYPERKEFHVEEVISFNFIAIQYFLAVDNIKEAELRMKILQDLDEEHPKTVYSGQHLNEWYHRKAAERWERENKTRKRAVWKNNRSHLQTTRPPQFNFPEQIKWLYENDLSISHVKIEQILQLNSEKLSEDLEKLLQDSIARFNFFVEETKKNGSDNAHRDFPIHALLLLAELRSERSLPSILELLKQDTDFYDFWFADFLDPAMENALYYCGKNQINKLLEFLKLPNIYHGNMSIVGKTLVMIIERSEEKRETFVEEYRSVLKVLIENANDENYADTETTAYLIGNFVDLGYSELLPEIKQLFDLNLVGVWIYETYEEVETDIKKESFWQDTSFIKKSIYEKYEEMSSNEIEATSPAADEESFADLYHQEMLKKSLFEDDANGPFVNSGKTGRNDPCPCGSGKKYKKCCM